MRFSPVSRLRHAVLRSLPMTKPIVKDLVASALIVLVSSASFSAAQGLDAGAPVLITEDGPSGSAMLFQAPPFPDDAAPPEWLLKTGMKKGIRDARLQEERAAAPDIAVLAAGSADQWRGLLAGMREPSVAVRADSVAMLARTQPVLIVPSGGLSGAGGSEFFKAGLAEYVRSGGTLVCFSQRTGADYESLPVPPGSKLEAVGWAQDDGPVFGASSIRMAHPALSRMTRPDPRIETSGYLTDVPAESQILLARSDGQPTLIIYPFGSGRVIVSSLFSDVLSGLGHLDDEERGLIQDLLLWAKTPTTFIQAAPGETLSFTIQVHDAERKDVASVKFFAFRSGDSKPVAELEASVPSGAVVPLTLPFRFRIDDRFRPGLYHIEYVLLDAHARWLMGTVEALAGRFSIGRPPVSGARPKPSLLPVPAGRLDVRPSLLRSGNNLKVTVEMNATAASRPSSPRNFLVRIGDKERSAKLAHGRASLTVDLPEKNAGPSIPVAIYAPNSRLVFRDSLPFDAHGGQDIQSNRSSYLPGQKALISSPALGDGELNIAGLGQMDSQMLTGKRSITLDIPDNIPAGAYPLAWTFQDAGGRARAGTLFIPVEGYRVSIREAFVTATSGTDNVEVTALFRVTSDHAFNGTLRTTLRGPDRLEGPAGEKSVAIRKGQNEIPFSITFKPGSAGIWRLDAAVRTILPEGAGYPAGPMTVATRRVLFDAGDAFLLGVATDQPVYYDPSGPVTVLAVIAGKGKTRLKIALDGSTEAKERIKLAGVVTRSVRIARVKQGWHELTAELEDGGAPSRRGLAFSYGTNLPDLEASVLAAEPRETSVEIGLGVKNRGTVRSDKTTAALYEGDPAKGGKRIETVDVPLLDPGRLHVSLIKLPLFGKAGLRTFFVSADRDNDLSETDKRNNTASTEMLVPDFLVTVRTPKTTVEMNDAIPYSVSLANLTEDSQRKLTLNIQVIGTTGEDVQNENVTIDKLRTGREEMVERVYTPTAPLPPGILLISTKLLRAGTEVASGSATAQVMPRLSLAGSLAETPRTADLCSPFTVRYAVKSTGNVPVSSGMLTVELRRPGEDKPVLARKAPLPSEPATLTIERLDVPAGRYVLDLTASIANQKYKLKEEIRMAEQELTVSGPVRAAAGGSFPRVLVWLGRTGVNAEGALSEKLIREAFAQEGVYFRMVDTPEDFAKLAMSGIYNTFVLFEASEPLESASWLRDLTEQGRGMVIAGIDTTEQAAARAFGVTMGEPLFRSGGLLTMAETSGLSGTVPVSGTVLAVKKRGAAPLALTEEEKSAALLDTDGKSRVAVLPFSLVRSARESGSSTIYGLVLRAATLAVTPAKPSPDDASAGIISLSASSGPLKARVVVTLPPGSELVWTSGEGAVLNNSITYELSLDTGAKKVMYLYEKSAGIDLNKPVVEVFYECDGKWVSQGLVE